MHTSEDPDESRLFSKAFVLKVNELTHKFHTMMHHTIKNQHEDRRLAAIEAKDDLNYAKAFYELDLRKMKISTEIEDIIFDYFGIIEMQFEAANNFFKDDPGFQVAKTNLHAKITVDVAKEFGLDDSEVFKTLTHP